jgi:hypothetical protein
VHAQLIALFPSLQQDPSGTAPQALNFDEGGAGTAAPAPLDLYGDLYGESGGEGGILLKTQLAQVRFRRYVSCSSGLERKKAGLTAVALGIPSPFAAQESVRHPREAHRRPQISARNATNTGMARK